MSRPGASPVNILLTSAGRRGELVKILKDVVHTHGTGGGVFTADRSPHTSAGWLSDGLDLVPPIADSQYVPALLEICRRRQIRHLIPTIDPELPLLAQHREAFSEVGTTVWVSSPQAVAIAQDKRLTNRWMHSHGLPAVRQVEAAAISDLAATDFPVFAKPVTGSSSVGLRQLSDAAEADTLDPRFEYVIETTAPGEEFTVDVLVDRAGSCRQAVPRKRLETRAGEVSKALTVADESLTGLAARVVESLPGAYGVMNVQIFKDEHSGVMNVIEINARFGGGFPLTWAAGALMPLWLVQEIHDPRPTASLDWLPDQLMLRYDTAVHLDCRS